MAGTPQFNPLKSKRAFEETSAEIRRLIIQGIFKPGDRLPSENEMARQFKVGRQTVREALRLLELSGFITIQQGGGGGPIVSNTTLASLSNSLIHAIQMKNVTIEELTLARLEIEKLVMPYVVENASEQDIEGLRENIVAGRDRLALGAMATRENVDFHVLLARASRNNVFVIVVEAIMAVVAGFVTRIPQTLLASERVLKEHEEILQAVIMGDKSLAASRMESHIRNINNRFNDTFRQVAERLDDTNTAPPNE